MTSPLIFATLIYDGGDVLTLPVQMMPAGKTQQEGVDAIKQCGQFEGTHLERLCETAARVCYDSAGRGRNSVDMHKHLLEVGHLSVLEHANFTVEWQLPFYDACTSLQTGSFMSSFLNRPSLFVGVQRDCDHDGVGASTVRATMNLRHALEWEVTGPNAELGEGLRYLAHTLAPQIVSTKYGYHRCGGGCIVAPKTDDEKWVTMLLTGSRGFSHELVRHGDWTAISQRSTRYVDESESRWVMHPLEDAYLTEHADDIHPSRGRVIGTAQDHYRQAVATLEPWLIARGVDKVSARKQARGAARGYLGNALYTEVVFSANLTQWKRMLRQRLNAAADAEIRQCFAGVLRELQRSRYADSFVGWTTAPSPDGIGEVLVEPS
jgi:thymidylate synthase ThyX